MAKDMNATSSEIAQAAVEFWRQGLREDEVNKRLRYTTAYAKISAMDFSEAAELMTAATNGMEVEADRVADVWAYLGDASASGADEIGVAMQKVAASSKQVGVSFEWLGAYIATLSEKTRLAPEAIGTALNSMMARLQQVKEKGYNDDDDFGINQIAGALANIDVALLDSQGNWRNMSDILLDVAGKWTTIDDKTRSYIATVMGSTRQMNYFLTLMNDLSKGAEGGSKAWELYSGAMNSAGTAMEKYAIWEESVEAAQNRLTAEMEEFYSILQGGTIKSWYDGLAGIVGGVNDATEATGGFNLAAGVTATVVALLTTSFMKMRIENDLGSISLGKQMVGALTGFTKTAKGATVVTSGLGLAMRSIGIGLAITAVVSLISHFASMADRAEEAAKEVGE